MATVTTTGRDGRRGLLAFTCVESMHRWDPKARPVPVPTSLAVQAALADGADAVVVDLAGPVVFAIEGSDLQRLGSDADEVTRGAAATCSESRPGGILRD
jgi:hypothetical protein